MNGKLLILAVGVGIGFILGSRAGRGPYEKLSAATSKIWHDPRVQTQVDRSIAFANDKIEEATDIVTTGTKNVVERITAPRTSTRKAPARKAPARKRAPQKKAPSGE
jgi:hypothetical protein